MKILLLYPLHFLNFIISLIFPKSRNIWIYGEWFGDKACDNSYYAFNAKGSRKIKKIWITRSAQVYRRIRSDGKECYYTYSLIGLYYQARAGVYFCTVNSKDFCFSSLTPRVVYFQMWHGLPLKRIGFDVSGRSGFHRAIDLLRHKTVDAYTHILSPSSFFDDAFVSAFKVNREQLVRCLYPRCDGLFVSGMAESDFYNNLDLPANCKVAFYLPTHRDEGRAPHKIQGLIDDMKSLNNFAARYNLVIVVKPHYYEAENFSSERLSNVIVTDNLPGDLYACLYFSDFIITDYSSVAMDYMVAGKPIFFYAPDIVEYELYDRPGYFKYSEVLKGPSLSLDSLQEELISFLENGKYPAPLPFDFPELPKNTISDEFQTLVEKIVYEN